MSTRNTTLALVVLATLSACALEAPPKPADYRAEALPGVAGAGPVDGAG